MDIFVGVDVDGTIFEHKYPQLGAPVPLAFFYLKKLNAMGCKIILWTMRSKDHPHGRDTAQEARDELENHGVDIFAVNKNPSQWFWTSSPKVYCHFYIDDAAIGTPLIYPSNGSNPYVDWSKIGPMAIEAVSSKLKQKACYIEMEQGREAAEKFLKERGVLVSNVDSGSVFN